MRVKSFLIALVAIMLPVMSFADPVNIDGFWLNLNMENKTAEVTCNPDEFSANSYSGNIVVPSNILYDGVKYDVVSIGKYAFRNCPNLISIDIPSSVTAIGDYAFECDGSFRNKSLLSSVSIPDGVSSIGKYSFLNCVSLASIRIPNGVLNIGEGAFASCSSLNSIDIPSSVKSIELYAFKNCTSLTSVNIHDIVSWLNIKFGYSTKETHNYDPPEIYNYVEIYNYDYSSNPLKGGAKLFLNGEEVNELVIPDGVASISSVAFHGCSSIKSVTLPHSVRYIGEAAFANCVNLASISFANVLNIGYKAFYACRRLKSVFVSDIGSWLNMQFSYKTIVRREFGYGLDDIVYDYDYSGNPLYGGGGAKLFQDGEEVNELVIPDGIKSISEYAFYNCSSIKHVEIPRSVSSIGTHAFGSCKDISSLTICTPFLFDKDVFSECKINHLLLNFETITDYYKFLLENSTDVEIVLGDNCKVIEDNAFSGINGIKTITIGNSVETIGSRAFAGIDNLETVICKVEKIPDTHRTAFENSYIDYATLYVPSESLEEYKETGPWKGFKEIVAIDDNEKTYTLTYMVDGEVYKIYSMKEGEAIIPEPDPTKDGYVFSGWDDLPSVMPGEDVTVKGTFTEIPPGKCATPTIDVVQGDIVFACETEDVTYHYDIKSLDDKIGEGNNIKLTHKYQVSVYASKEGYDDSDVTTKDVCMPSVGDTNCDGAVNAADIVTIVNMIMISGK